MRSTPRNSIYWLSQKNTFVCDVLASKGTAHLNSLCKWGKNTFCYRKRKFPSGIPYEKKISFMQPDPTWKAVYLFFKNLIKNNIKTDLRKDIILNKSFHQIN